MLVRALRRNAPTCCGAGHAASWCSMTPRVQPPHTFDVHKHLVGYHSTATRRHRLPIRAPDCWGWAGCREPNPAPFRPVLRDMHPGVYLRARGASGCTTFTTCYTGVLTQCTVSPCPQVPHGLADLGHLGLVELAMIYVSCASVRATDTKCTVCKFGRTHGDPPLPRS